MSVENEVYLNELFSEYSVLLTDNQRDIFDMHFRLDLSLGEIAEIRGVSRQSVADALSGVKKQLLFYEEKLRLYSKRQGIYALIDRLSPENKAIGDELIAIMGDD